MEQTYYKMIIQFIIFVKALLLSLFAKVKIAKICISKLFQIEMFAKIELQNTFEIEMF